MNAGQPTPPFQFNLFVAKRLSGQNTRAIGESGMPVHGFTTAFTSVGSVLALKLQDLCWVMTRSLCFLWSKPDFIWLSRATPCTPDMTNLETWFTDFDIQSSMTMLMWMRDFKPGGAVSFGLITLEILKIRCPKPFVMK